MLALLVWIMVRYRASANPVPSKIHHNTLLEVAWTLIPVIILVVIAIPSFRLLYFEADIPKPDVTIKAIGKQWFWTYEYPGRRRFTFDSLGLSDADAAKAGKPRLLGVDNAVYVPVNKVIEVETTGADVIHSWALPADGREDGRRAGPHQPHLVQGHQAPASITASARNCAAPATPSCRSRCMW